MHNLYIIWRYDFRFVACKVSVDVFSLLYSKLLLAKLCLFVFDATFAELIDEKLDRLLVRKWILIFSQPNYKIPIDPVFSKWDSFIEKCQL